MDARVWVLTLKKVIDRGQQSRTDTFRLISEERNRQAFCGIVQRTTQEKTITAQKRKGEKTMITRTIKTTTATVNIFATETAELFQNDYIVPTTDAEKALKWLRKNRETDDFKIVNILQFNEIEKLYGIDEEDFMKYAVELDPVTRKPL